MEMYCCSLRPCGQLAHLVVRLAALPSPLLALLIFSKFFSELESVGELGVWRGRPVGVFTYTAGRLATTSARTFLGC